MGTKTFNPSLLQKESSMNSDRRALASKVLANAAHKSHNPRLATLAVRVRLDEFKTNGLQTEKKEREKADLTAKIEDLELTIKQLTEAIDALKAEIAEMQVQLKRAGEDREKE